MGRRARTRAPRRALSGRRRAFPLVPRRRLTGTPFGERRSSRRGRGADIAGTRPYLPGDPVATIDWFASARLSSARGSDEFVVRETYAEEAPRVLVVADRAPSMGLYRPGLPWLDKAAALLAATEAIERSAIAARAELGHADAAGGHTRFLSPGAVAPRHVIERVRRATFDAPPGSLGRVLAELLNRRAELPQGTFFFVISDFLDEVPHGVWTRLRSSRWDVVPVVVQDPTWEQSFPDIANVVLPFTSADGAEDADVRLTCGEVAARKHGNEARRAALLRRFRTLEFDPVLLGVSEPFAVDGAFLRWAERRRLRRSRRR
jgi:uncharacterized protein (DUF58 family)